MIDRQARANVLRAVRAMTTLIDDDTHPDALPVAPAIGLWPADPMRRCWAPNCLLPIRRLAREGTELQQTTPLDLPRLSFKTGAALGAEQLDRLNPLRVSTSASALGCESRDCSPVWVCSLGFRKRYDSPWVTPGSVVRKGSRRKPQALARSRAEAGRQCSVTLDQKRPPADLTDKGNHSGIIPLFCGSGSTLVAADRLGFSATGIDSDAHALDIARRRLAEDAGMFSEVVG